MAASSQGVGFGALCCTFAFTAQANAACYDTGIQAFADAPRTIELCVDGACEDALLMRSCGNVHYASQDYDAGSVRWLFGVRFQQDGPEDDEFTVLRNGEEIPDTEAANISCASEPGTGDCAFVDSILRRSWAE